MNDYTEVILTIKDTTVDDKITMVMLISKSGGNKDENRKIVKENDFKIRDGYDQTATTSTTTTTTTTTKVTTKVTTTTTTTKLRRRQR